MSDVTKYTGPSDIHLQRTLKTLHPIVDNNTEAPSEPSDAMEKLKERRKKIFEDTITIHENNILQHIDLGVMSLGEIDEMINILTKVRNLFTDSRFMTYEDFDIEPIFYGDIAEVGIGTTHNMYFISREKFIDTSKKLTNDIFINDSKYTAIIWDMIKEPLSKSAATVFFPRGLFKANRDEADMLIVKMNVYCQDDVLDYLTKHRDEIIEQHNNFMSEW